MGLCASERGGEARRARPSQPTNSSVQVLRPLGCVQLQTSEPDIFRGPLIRVQIIPNRESHSGGMSCCYMFPRGFSSTILSIRVHINPISHPAMTLVF